MSHIATEEWQSFELRMRRRRAERMLVRAEAALDSGCLDEARAALDEARRLAPTLPPLDEVEAKIAQAAAAPASTPVTRARRPIAVAAGVIIVAMAAGVGWRFLRMSPGSAPIAPQAAAAAPAADTVKPTPVPATAPPSIRVETQQVPPTIVSGTDAPEDPDPPEVKPPIPAMKAAALVPSQPTAGAEPESRAVGTAGSPAIVAPVETATPAPVDPGIGAPLGKETQFAPPQPSPEPIARAANVPARIDETPSSVPAARVEPGPAVRVEPGPAARVEPGPPSAPKKPDDVTLVRGILDKYADAYTRLDADAAKAVWPSVNRAALSRAFSGLNEQRIAFADCSVLVRSTEARATCSGSTTWEPKIGGGPRTDVRRWAFDLEKSGDAWIIRDARVQNR